MVQAVLTDQKLMEAGIAASLASNPALVPSPSSYFQDFHFGQTMWDAAYGNVDGESISGVGEAVADVAINNVLEMEERKRKEDDPAKDASMIFEAGEQQRAALARMQARSAQLGQEIAQMEAQFEAEMGDAWREIFANEILDPEQAQRSDGETMEQYRARLEMLTTAEMLDRNGNIKPEYADHPLAQWVQARTEKAQIDNRIEHRIDPNTSAVEASQIDRDIVREGTFNQIRQGQAELRMAGQDSEILASGTDVQRDDVEVSGEVETNSELAAFASPPVPSV